LTDSTDGDILGTELESRLDDLFGEEDAAASDSDDRDPAKSYPLAELKNLVLSIDWEITDEVLKKFLQQIKDLKLTYEHDKIVVTFLQILNSLGGYIKTNRGNAHPKTFKTLNAVFAHLDKVVLSKDMTDRERKKMLRAAMNSYQKLRVQISARKASARRKTKADTSITLRAETPAETPKADADRQPIVPSSEAIEEEVPITEERGASIESLSQAVEEIKAYIHTEIEELKKRIELLDQGQ